MFKDVSIGLNYARIEDVEDLCYLGYLLDCEGGEERPVSHRTSLA